jgi:glycosyltransferase involved in cell wall biosynthesis
VHKPRIIFTVTNDLCYDQRMQRICGTLARHGYDVTLVGRLLPQSPDLREEPFAQVRLRCFFHKGFAFYAAYNLRLFAYLLFARYDAVCSIDLDTLPAGCMASLLRRKKRVFDAHEYFTEVPEVVGRPFVKAFWAGVARVFLPFYRHAYTVGPALAGIFSEKYGIPFRVVRNTNPQLPPRPARLPKKRSVLLYQGALNEGRGIEALLRALPLVPEATLLLAGEGDLSQKLRLDVQRAGLQERVTFLGMLRPDALREVTEQADIGLNLLENKGLSYYYSLANKFFDTVQAEIPSITMDFPEYRALQAEHEVAVLLPDLSPEGIAHAISRLLHDDALYYRLCDNCRRAKEAWCWESEEGGLLGVWGEVLPT